MQRPLEHWLALPQGMPFASFGTQMPAEQYCWPVPPSPIVPAQSASLPQLPLQAIPELSQPVCSQSCCMSGLHEPSLWQVPPSVATPFSQLAGAPHACEPSG